MSGQGSFEDRRWASYDQELTWRHQAALRLVRREPVLDVGGGDGLFIRLLRERGCTRLKLLDLSPIAVQKARDSGIDADLVDLTAPLPFEDESFGTVCALDVLEHLFDPIAALREMARVGTEVVAVVPNFHYWKDRAQMLVGRVPFQSKPRRGHVHWFNQPILDDVVGQAGLRIDAAVYGGFLRLGSIGPLLARKRPNLFATAFALRLTK